MTDQLLTEKLERNIDILLRRWLGFTTNKLTRAQVSDVFKQIGLFKNFENRPQPLKEMQPRFNAEMEFLDKFWRFMATMMEESAETVKMDAFSETLKVLASPYMSR